MSPHELLRQTPLVNLQGPKYPDTAPSRLSLPELRLPPSAPVGDVFAVWLREIDAAIETSKTHDTSAAFDEWFSSQYATSRPPGMDATLTLPGSAAPGER